MGTSGVHKPFPKTKPGVAVLYLVLPVGYPWMFFPWVFGRRSRRKNLRRDIEVIDSRNEPVKNLLLAFAVRCDEYGESVFWHGVLYLLWKAFDALRFVVDLGHAKLLIEIDPVFLAVVAKVAEYVRDTPRVPFCGRIVTVYQGRNLFYCPRSSPRRSPCIWFE
jgi:hypothetical protein